MKRALRPRGRAIILRAIHDDVGQPQDLRTAGWLHIHECLYNYILVGVLTILKNISQWEGLSHILWKIKNVPNHQLCVFMVKRNEKNHDSPISLQQHFPKRMVNQHWAVGTSRPREASFDSKRITPSKNKKREHQDLNHKNRIQSESIIEHILH